MLLLSASMQIRKTGMPESGGGILLPCLRQPDQGGKIPRISVSQAQLHTHRQPTPAR
jgi:hypothetical protein